MSTHLDLRVVKTKNLIQSTFIELIKQEGFKKITINDISRSANINRSTFYLHYTDKYDLLNQIVDRNIDQIINSIPRQLHVTNNALDYDTFAVDLDRTLKVVATNDKLYEFILNDPESLGLAQKIEKALQQRLDKLMPEETLVTRDLLLEIVSSIYLSVIRWWLAHDMKYSSKFLAKELVHFFELGSKSILKGTL
ncbi:TetR/AcrR family transcriptional regulator [Agrilactobacillus composti]|uniref:TetR/AcrR family transcriptional regulator n=1 Tax=Agrilactobacillus composti TaxID=398555 RepID=UPI00054F849A|nr:TetR family transcriptional regulator [Agrilactobacillus composti]